MQSLLKSFVESIKPVVEGTGSAVVAGGSNDDAAAVASCSIDGIDYTTVPSPENGEPIWPALDAAKLQEGWENLKQTVSNSETAQQHFRQAGELVTKGWSMATESVKATAKVVLDDVNALRTASHMDVEIPRVATRPLPPPPPGHPFATLPWEDLETKYKGEPWLDVAEPQELRQGIKRLLRRVSQDESLFDFPPPPSEYHFDFDPWRQAFAAAMVVIDQELARLRYEMVPKRLREEDFWLMYFYRVEKDAIPSIPKEIVGQLVEMRAAGGENAVVGPQEREERANKRIHEMKKKLQQESGATSSELKSASQASLLGMIGRVVGADVASPPQVAEPAVVELTSPQRDEVIVGEDPTPTPDQRIGDEELEEFEKMLAGEL